MTTDTMFAAIDLGSNSFRLEIARFVDGQIQRVHYWKETVRLGAGLDAQRQLSLESMQKGWDCLAQFAQHLRGFTRAQVRAVATQTLREARNRDIFIQRANAILGHPIEVISGPTEAQLIYQGVSYLLPQDHTPRLVIDIGGRSTEIILGVDHQVQLAHSIAMGSVSWSMAHFHSGELSEAAFAGAEFTAQAVLEATRMGIQPDQWQVAYGASGTMGAVAKVLAQAGGEPDCITLDAVRWLRQNLIAYGHVDHIRLDGLKKDRRAVIGGGLSLLHALMMHLKIDALQIAPGALRHGVLFDRYQSAMGIEARTPNGVASSPIV